MINFSTLQGLTIPEGVVTQIADASGRVIWMLPVASEPVILEVEKQTITTYAGETSYANESVVLLDIYPKKSNSTVNVTYGGLTKTLTFSGTNAQKVYFGTYNGVSDATETPTSGTLTIDGECSGFACGAYQSGSKTINTSYAPCITAVSEWGNVTIVPNYAFYKCKKIAITALPSGIKSIGQYAFYNCTGITLHSLPSDITSIPAYAFYGCSNLALTELPSGIKSIGKYAFNECAGITISELPSGITSIPDGAFYGCDKLALTELPDGITSIGVKAFCSCDAITSIILHEGLLTIGNDAFNVHYLKNITIPSTVTSIGARAFAYHHCSPNNFSVRFMRTVPPTLGVDGEQYNQFISVNYYNNDNTTIIVPSGCGEVYKADESWISSGYADIVTEVS